MNLMQACDQSNTPPFFELCCMLGCFDSCSYKEADGINRHAELVYIYPVQRHGSYPKPTYAFAANTATLSSGRLKLNVPFPLAVRVVVVVLTTSLSTPL